MLVTGDRIAAAGAGILIVAALLGGLLGLATAAKLAEYEWGFVSDIEQEFAPTGLSEDTVRFISAKKEEPQWLLDWRLKAFSIWQQTQEREPTWARVTYPKIDYQEIYYYAAPKRSNVKPKRN